MNRSRLGCWQWDHRRAQAAQRALRDAAADVSWPTRGRLHAHTVARSRYLAAWAQEHGRALATWLAERSRHRRWGPGVGDERRILGSATGFTAATHLLRMLVDTLLGSARWRSHADRLGPRLCAGCAAPASYAWATAGPNHHGAA